ncbi:hypothetical protein GCM10008090_23630 [Arenicella chitinivorans]|uniref:Uncharacterized protein n=1 Tax=Arenicella chitinivorans TaxID=1329800 RepID=A0A918RW22_9GAMM|nr:hypothetical protein [Arenicella chitinivorans]GHA13179.1 hypothetical protein GCM10008090_23630 [Arenicella chitinivorans]
MSKFDLEDPQTSFGAFKPVGNVVAVFNDADSAARARTDLEAGGYQPDEVTLMRSVEFTQLLDEMREDQHAIALLGSELRKTDEFRDHADRGATFLVIYAPSDEETKRAMRVVSRYNYHFALKYGHLLIERFDPAHPANH